jgi:DNA polymerase III epsilon subunit-like protein
MVTLIFDTETTGQINFRFPIISNTQPHMVQLAAELVLNGKVRASIDLLIDPGVPIPEEAQKIHGITDELVQKFGVSPVVAIGMFHNLAKNAERLVAHNIDFDLTVLEIIYARISRSTEGIRNIPRVCTMKSSIDLLKIPGKYGYKWPSLIEAYKLLVDSKGFDRAHSAIADVQACRRVLYALEQKGVPLIGGSK